MEKTTVERRGFIQRMLCLAGGAAGASALEPKTRAVEALPETAPASAPPGTRFYLRCRHHHNAKQGRKVCRGEILEKAGGEAAGEFYSNCFQAESTFGVSNPFAASNIELHTIRLRHGTLFGMGANSLRNETEKAHAILGGTGAYAGARGTYVIKEGAVDHETAELTISLLS